MWFLTLVFTLLVTSGSTQTLPVAKQNLLLMIFLYKANFVIEAFSSENTAETYKQ